MMRTHRDALVALVAGVALAFFASPGTVRADGDEDDPGEDGDDEDLDLDDEDDGEDLDLDDEGDGGDEGEDGDDPAAPAEKPHHVEYPGPLGASGLVHTMSARTGEPLSWSLGMHVSFFKMKGFLYQKEVKDTHTSVAASAHLRFTPIEYLELFASVSARSNATNLAIQQPSLFQTIGDFSFGVKGLYTFADMYTLALAVVPRFVNSVGETGFDWSATSVTLMLANTLDFAAKTGFPLLVHVNLGWDFNNTAKLVDQIETQMDQDPAHPHYIMRFERYALGISRNDAFLAGLALEFKTPWVQPFLEWNMALPVNRQDFLCAQRGPLAFPDDDSCMAQEGFKGVPVDLTLGLRFQPLPVPELSIILAADIGLSGTKTFVRETVPNEPYVIWLAASYSFVKRTELVEIEKIIEKEIVKEVAPPPGPRILGQVVDAESGKGVAGAMVQVLDADGKPVDDLGMLATGDDGTFISQHLEAGTYRLGIEAALYEPCSDCTAELEAGEDLELECQLVPLPRPATVKGKVTDSETGEAMPGAAVTVDGPETVTCTTDAMGLFEVQVEAGDYSLSGKLEGFFDKQVGLTADPGATHEVDVAMNKVPKQKLVVLKKKQIVIKKQIQFEFDQAKILPESFMILDWVAQVLKENPQLTLVEIQGHTDDKGAADYNLDLSQKRADAVRDYLIEAGIDPARLVAKGYGETVPIVPNVTAKGRAQNRRVEFHILSQD